MKLLYLNVNNNPKFNQISTMILQRTDIEKIVDVLDKFPEINSFEINEENCSGIGNIITMTFAKEINGLTGSFNVEISGVENW